MLKQFENYIKEYNLVKKDESSLLTVSGGIDSVVLCELYYQAGYSFGIAHCNFQLRGEESDLDAEFVKALADKYKVPLFSVVFDTNKFAKDLGISTQMAARDLRYEWFEKIRSENSYDKIATAHHQDDQVETFFINLMRGTGISGLHGIKPIQNSLIRPMLFASRKEIVHFLEKNHLTYREDSSNASDKYLRNRIRHHIMPVLEDIDSEYLKMFSENMKRFSASEEIYLQQIENVRNEIITSRGNDDLISIEKLMKLNPISTYLFELIREFGFSFKVCEDIISSLGKDSGKIFYSESHRLLKDRECLIIREIKEKSSENIYQIEKGISEIKIPIHLKIEELIKAKDFKISAKRTIANLDFDELKFPLSLRKWKQGDYFHPLGSSYRKKISDFFIDKKLSLFEKEDCWLLCSNDEVVWIVSHQLDNRFKITSKTQKVLKLELL
jgi:tRNA(Ile)-lysidine synthase